MCDRIECIEEEGFIISDDSTCEWALKQIKKAKDEKERMTALWQEQIDKAKDGIEAENRRYENETAFLRSKVMEYTAKVEMKETKTQLTYRLLTGKLVIKKASIKLEKDEEKLLEYCKKNCSELVKVTESVKWAELKPNLAIAGDKVIDTTTGEEVDGVTVTEDPEIFDIKFN